LLFPHLDRLLPAQVKLAEGQIFEYKKKLADADAKLRQQQGLYETVRAERNLHSKNLIEAQGEIADMKRKLKIMNHQIDQLKDEIASKEASLAKEHSVHDEVIVLTQPLMPRSSSRRSASRQRSTACARPRRSSSRT
jgi:chromosome segregation ATPase